MTVFVAGEWILGIVQVQRLQAIQTNDTIKFRKNAIQIRRVNDGVKVYVIGIGGYTGNNPGVAQDLATVINSL